MPKRIVFTGGSGKAGRHVVPWLKNKGYDILNVDLKPLEVGRNPFRPGDIVITSGTGGLYPPLVPIARVARLEGDNAIGIPLADPSATSFAIVEQPFEPEAAALPAAQDQGLP